MVATHSAAMEGLKRAMLPGQTFEGRDQNLKHATKLLSLYARQVEVLDKHRGKGQQKVTVEHVHVEKGGQAIVGNVETGGTKRRRKSEYILNEKRMRRILADLGTEGTALIIRDDEHREVHRLEGPRLREAFELLEQLGEKVHLLDRRGIDFASLVARRHEDPEGEARLPRLQVHLPDGTVRWFWSEKEEAAYLEEAGVGETDPDLDAALGVDTSGEAPKATRRELHETRQLDALFEQLASYGLDIADYGLRQEESVTGETLPTRFLLVGEGEKEGESSTYPVANLAGIVEQILDFGRAGMTIKRFKGLGEMDAEQLWETTMNPENRVLLRVTWDAASFAEKLFSILMGEEVAPRRQYIEEHALEVKNLDV